MQKNKEKIMLGLVVLLVVVVLWLAFGGKIRPNSEKYTVVYTSTGEIYVGKLSLLGFNLKDVYLYQATKDTTDPNKTNFQLQPVKEALWAPSYMHLVRQNVIFYGPLDPTSKIADTLKSQVK